MTQFDEITALYGQTRAGAGEIDDAVRNDLPVIVGVVEWVAGNLLPLAGNTSIIVAQRVPVSMAMEIGLRFLVSDGDRVVVFNASGLCAHHIVAQRLLECGRHEIVTWSGFAQNGEMNLEPEQVNEERHQNEPGQTGHEVFCKFWQSQSPSTAVDVQETPKIYRNRTPDGKEREHSDVFGRYDTAHSDACEQEPLPPLLRKGLVPHLIESNVAKDTERHGEHQGRVQENESGLANVGIVEQD